MRKDIFLLLIIGLNLAEIQGQKGRIWTLMVSPGWGNIQYKNENGIVVGVAIELIDLVCQEAEMDCRLIETPLDYCWQNNPGDLQSGGKGLLARKYDACCSWIHTIERSHVFEFSIPYFGGYDGFLYTHIDRDLDPYKLQGKKIGFVQGAFTNEQCLTRETRDFVPVLDLIKHFTVDNLSKAVIALRNGQLDGFFLLVNVWPPGLRKEVKKVSDPIQCYVGGTSIMSRKDSAFIANWNMGFNKFKNTNKFEKFCKDANERHIGHGGKAACLT